MKKYLTALALVCAAAVALNSQTAPQGPAPQFTPDGKLILPKDYREWIFLSAGIGMTYGTPDSGRQQNFDDVFVSPAAYRAFIQTGRWPAQTIFVLEQRTASSKGTVNKGSVGRYQSDLIGIVAEVKDRSRSPEGEWAYFSFGTNSEAAPVLPKTAACYGCHSQNAAVENTFVQFYPTLLPIARAKGTLNASFKE
jgi:hypothetical protein